MSSGNADAVALAKQLVTDKVAEGNVHDQPVPRHFFFLFFFCFYPLTQTRARGSMWSSWQSDTNLDAMTDDCWQLLTLTFYISLYDRGCVFNLVYFFFIVQ